MVARLDSSLLLPSVYLPNRSWDLLLEHLEAELYFVPLWEKETRAYISTFFFLNFYISFVLCSLCVAYIYVHKVFVDFAWADGNEEDLEMTPKDKKSSGLKDSQ